MPLVFRFTQIDKPEFPRASYSPSLKTGTMSGFNCARYTIAHIIQQHTVAVMISVMCNRLVEGPLLQQILAHKDAITPIATKIRVVTKKPIFVRSHTENTSLYSVDISICD